MRTRRLRRRAPGAAGGEGGSGGGSGSAMASATATAALLLCSGAALLGSASAFVRPPLGSPLQQQQQQQQQRQHPPPPPATTRGDGPLVRSSSFSSPLPSVCSIAATASTRSTGGRRTGAGALQALLGGAASVGAALGISPSAPPPPPGGGGGAGGGWRRGGGGTALRMMARRETWTDIPMKDFYDALATYIEEYGSREVPEDYTVPFDPTGEGRWPERMQGLRLGKYFKKLVTEAELREQDPEMVERLEGTLGVKVGMSDWDRFYLALQTFKRVKGSLKVLARFTVPAEAPWPEALWDYRLGVRVGNLRTTGRFLTGVDEATREERIALLDALGFEWKPRLPKKELEDLDAWFNPIVDALKVYARMGGDIADIKPSFVVPDSIQWPEALRGMALGQKLAYLRSRSGILNDHPEKKETLQELGLLLSSREAQNEEKFQLILLALETFRAVHGHCNVPQSFIVPDSEAWPEETRGMRLGVRVNAIRSQQTFIKNSPKRRAMLEELGFDTQPSKGAGARRSLDKDYEYTDDVGDDAAASSSSASAASDASASASEAGVGGGGGGSAQGSAEGAGVEEWTVGPPRNAADDLDGRVLTKEEILEIQRRAGLEWYFVNRQPGQSWFEEVEHLGLANYPFVPLLSAEQHVKTKQKGELSLRGNRINPFFVIQPPALKQHASEVEVYPTGSLLDTLAEEAAAALAAEDGGKADRVKILGKLREETQFSRIDYRAKLVPDDDVDTELPAAHWDEAAYWEGMAAISQGEMGEFGDGGSFDDILHALELFKERYGHVDVPLEFEFESPSPEEDEDDWFTSWTGRNQAGGEVDDDWDSEAEPEFLKNAVSLSSTYDPEAAAARREARMERRNRDSLAGLFEEGEEGEEDQELDLEALGTGLEKGGGAGITFDFENDDDDEEEDAGAAAGGTTGPPTPDDDPYVMWPPEVEKLPLGDICFLLRSGVIAAKNVPERRAALDALGFDWGNDEAYLDLRWDIFLGTYYYWRLIKGVPLVPWDFVVPEEAPWPFFCRGVELGRMCDLVRRSQEVFFKYYPERVQTLEYFGWKWWWPALDEGEQPDPPQPYNRYDNLAGMDLVMKLGFVDGSVLQAAEQPDWAALGEAIPESVPWREQDHMVGRTAVVEDAAAPSDLLAIPGRAKRRQQARARALKERAAGSAGRAAAAAIAAAEAAAVMEAEMAAASAAASGAEPVKRGRGRKPGSGKKAAAAASTAADGEAAAPKKRGRKPKSETSG